MSDQQTIIETHIDKDMEQITPLEWRNERRRLGDLHPWPINPRHISKVEAKRLAESPELFGQPETIQIEPDDGVVNGHQRLSVWLTAYGEDYEVDVRVANRKLTAKEKRQLTVYLHRGTVGDWDWETLANNFEPEELIEWGFNEHELGMGDIDIDFTPPPTDGLGYAEITFTMKRELRDELIEALRAHEGEKDDDLPGLSAALYAIVIGNGADGDGTGS